jgi:hypothetical protein
MKSEKMDISPKIEKAVSANVVPGKKAGISI